MAAETKAEVNEVKKERKKPKVKEGGSTGNVVTNTLTNVRAYFTDVRAELNKVSWPDRADVIRLTRIVLLVTVLSSLALGAIAILFSELVRYGVEYPIIFVVIFAAVIGATIFLFRRDSQKTGY
jgi:preprotein translocase SecE subunit